MGPMGPNDSNLIGGLEFSYAFVALGYSHYFFYGGLAQAYAAPAVLAEGFHAVERGAVFEVGAGGFGDDEAAHAFGKDADLVDGGAASVAGLAAGFAACAFEVFGVGRCGGADLF